MRLKSIYTITTIIGITWFFFGPLPHKKVQRLRVPVTKELVKNAEVKSEVIEKPATATTTIKPEISIKSDKIKTTVTKPKLLKVVRTRNNSSNKIALFKVSFAQLPGWKTAAVKKSFSAFQTSCQTFLKQNPNSSVGSQHITMKAGDWYPACKAALSIDYFTETTARTFFEKWFHPIEFKEQKPIPGKFTGYYMPRLEGSLTKTDKYNTPIYGVPNEKRLGNPLRRYTREQIDNGALGKNTPVIAWINSRIERLFLEIEGSGVIKLPSGKNLYLGYAAENGKPYTSIGGVLIRKGIMTKDNASKPAIKRYFETHPSKANTILNANKSFVFFQNLKQPMALGAKGMALTPGYSLAVDRQWIPLGAPLWLTTTRPDQQQENEKKFQRLMIAQDTGGAIRGLMRGDVYWGSGKKASYLGEHMKNTGRYWLLLPKRTLERLTT